MFKKLGQDPQGVQCPAIDGLISEADEVAGEVADKEVLDAAIIGSAQAVEHYEIARYGTLIAWAESVGHDDIVRLLNTNLNEEKAADRKLSTVALRKGVNRKAPRATVRGRPYYIYRGDSSARTYAESQRDQRAPRTFTHFTWSSPE